MPAARAMTAAPRIEPIRLGALEDGDPDDLRPRADLEGAHFAPIETGSVALTDAGLDSTRFDLLRARELDLKGTRFTDVVLEQVDVPAVRAMRTRWRDVRITGRLGSVEAYDAEWRSVHFTGCKIGFLNLRGAELLDVAFTECQIETLDLVGTFARRVALRGTRLGELNVQDGALRDVDLRGAEVRTIGGLRGLAGATLSPDQVAEFAPLFAAELGVRVEG